MFTFLLLLQCHNICVRHCLMIHQPILYLFIFSIVQVAFGVKIDSLVEADHPVIVNAKRLFSNDLTYANLVRFTLLFMAPKLANLLGIRINAQSVDYFNVFSTKIIADKRKSYLKGGGHGKASNFIELMLEAEAEEGGGNFTDALHGEEKEKLKCKFVILKWEFKLTDFIFSFKF